jgi:hypothetical protein
MSIEQLKQDLKAVISSLPGGPLTTAAEMSAYLKNNLLPFIESVVTEMEEMDGSIEDLVTQTPDVLHEETAAVFTGLITSGLTLVKELEDLAAKTGDSQRLKPLIKEWRELAEQGMEVIEDITLPDPDPETEPEQTSAVEPPALPPGAKA